MLACLTAVAKAAPLLFQTHSELWNYAAQSSHLHELTGLLDALTPVLQDNKALFFDAYTDHGLQHVEAVASTSFALLQTSTQLNLQAGRVDPDFSPDDAALLLAAIALHDVALHIRPSGLKMVVSGEWGTDGIPAFASHAAHYEADGSWPELWQSFISRMRRASAHELVDWGMSQDGTLPAILEDGPSALVSWDAHNLAAAGEFVRLHHHRLAQDIAQCGVPGTGKTTQSASGFLSMAGLVARSHGEDLRKHADFLTARYGRGGYQEGVRALHCMALLRVSDALQIKADRAPSLLLTMREPLAARSVLEWQKHAAVQHVVWEHPDHEAVEVQVGVEHSLEVHLALRRMIGTIQAEMDTTASVLAEFYAPLGVDRSVMLRKRRIVSNLDSPLLRQRLPYYPIDAQVRARGDLSYLLIDRLYGERPEIAGRELIQNALDATRALGDDGAKDAVIRLTVRYDDDAHSAEMSVQDTGVGMTPTVVADYFLAAGASFRPSPEALKTGRFGIGVLAAFLLGPRVRVSTRARGTSVGEGCSFELVKGSERTSLMRTECPEGTTVAVEFPCADRSAAVALATATAWYYWIDSPKLVVEVVDGRQNVSTLPTAIENSGLSPADWTSAVSRGVTVEFARHSGSEPVLVHNGVRVGVLRDPNSPVGRPVRAPTWSRRIHSNALYDPTIRYTDRGNKINLSLDRATVQPFEIPCEETVLRLLGIDIIAHALVLPGRRHPQIKAPAALSVLGPGRFLPPLEEFVSRYARGIIALVRPGSETPIAQRLMPAELGVDWCISQEAQSRLMLLGAPSMTMFLAMNRGGSRRSHEDEFLGRFGDRYVSGTVASSDLRGLSREEAAIMHERLGAIAGAFARQLAPRGFPAHVGILWNKESRVASTPLVEVWDAYVGGPMPLDDNERGDLASRLEERDQTLAARIAYWRRHHAGT